MHAIAADSSRDQLSWSSQDVHRPGADLSEGSGRNPIQFKLAHVKKERKPERNAHEQGCGDGDPPVRDLETAGFLVDEGDQDKR